MNGKDNANDDDADDTNDYDGMMMMQFENTATTAIGIALVAPRRSESPLWMNNNRQRGERIPMFTMIEVMNPVIMIMMMMMMGPTMD